MRAVDFARSENLLVAVRGGGHSLPGFSTCDDGVVVDLSAMTSVRVDPARRTAIAEGGCLCRGTGRRTNARKVPSGLRGVAATTRNRLRSWSREVTPER